MIHLCYEDFQTEEQRMVHYNPFFHELEFREDGNSVVKMFCYINISVVV